MEVDSTLEANIQKGQLEDTKIQEIKQLIKSDVKEICELILREVHDSAYSIHPGCTKMYQDLKTHFWWHGTKRHVAEYVALCNTCQRVKAEH
jgi:hypothetical protein